MLIISSFRLLLSPPISSSVRLLIISITSCNVICNSPDWSFCCIVIFKDESYHKLSSSNKLSFIKIQTLSSSSIIFFDKFLKVITFHRELYGIQEYVILKLSYNFRVIVLCSFLPSKKSSWASFSNSKNFNNHTFTSAWS